MDEIETALCEGLANRLLLHKAKLGSKKAMRIEIEYLLGADKALAAVGHRIPVAMQVCIMSGRPIFTVEAYQPYDC